MFITYTTEAQKRLGEESNFTQSQILLSLSFQNSLTIRIITRQYNLILDSLYHFIKIYYNRNCNL